MGRFFLIYFFTYFVFLLTPGPIPLDPGRAAVQNDGTFASVALVWTQLVSKTMFLVPVNIQPVINYATQVDTIFAPILPFVN